MSSSVAERRQPNAFTSFPKLPPELRLMIWELALDRPHHTVHVYPFEDDTGPRPISRLTLNFILEREYDLCMRHKGDMVSEHHERGRDRGMWRACTESRQVMKKSTRGPIESYFDNPLTARLTSILNADIIHLVRIPYPLDEIVTMGVNPGGWKNDAPGQGNQHVRYLIPDGYRTRFHIAACEYV
ncbi:uncharacterized protein FMAN_07867 [Fusarium mangiferae]|uniref:2EXR domain-containing protein n=1 Tax=Fusarium mangiferae TaxID=192010 RepID=A0A1L7TZV5_FUSMA|nr:uncharacterized protein FMAN_07867 [Fusarium mangiferae]CVL01643.1 uncharacterized protein FMAN_07867 [Fusarium mangiferae]